MRNIVLKFCFLGLLAITACSKMDDYKKYTDGREIVYSGKADSLVAHSGENRIKLSWNVLSDPKASKARIYWRNKADSVEVDIVRNELGSRMGVVLEDMTEGSYSFEVVTFHDDNTKSVPSYVNGRVYGAKYIEALLDRALLEIEVLKNDEVQLKWGDSSDTTMMGVELEYVNNDGAVKTLTIKNDEEVVIIEDYKKATSFKYRTFFKPNSLAIDNFYTEYNEGYPVYEKILDKSLFRDVTFPGDAYIYHDQGIGIAKINLWDGRFSVDFENPYYDYFSMITNDSRDQPHHITIDLGVTEKLKRFRLNHYYPYTNRAPRKYEIWGAENPSADGGWDGWTKLSDVEQVKPSGGPGVTDADKRAWEAGDNVDFSTELPKVRYIRIKCIENWRGWDTNMGFSELTFWGYEQNN